VLLAQCLLLITGLDDSGEELGATLIALVLDHARLVIVETSWLATVLEETPLPL